MEKIDVKILKKFSQKFKRKSGPKFIGKIGFKNFKTTYGAKIQWKNFWAKKNIKTSFPKKLKKKNGTEIFWKNCAKVLEKIAQKVLKNGA